MDKSDLRKGDFVASVLLILFGVFIIVESTKMPMEASYGGVESHWYVAPALFPLFTGSMLILLGFGLMAVAVRDKGARTFFSSLGTIRFKAPAVSDRSARVLTVVLGIGSLIYILVPRVDFFISIATFLFFLTTAFYPQNRGIRKRLTLIFGVESAVFGICAFSGLWPLVYGIHIYILDSIALLFLVLMILTAFRTAKSAAAEKKLIRRTLRLSLIVPLILCPLFRYALRIPLPFEGLIVDYMNLAYFILKQVIGG